MTDEPQPKEKEATIGLPLLAKVQQALKVDKSLKNEFAGFNYRNAEQILEAVKPLLGKSVITLDDTIKEVGGRIYVEAAATFFGADGKNVRVTAYAREQDQKKGMDEAQVTGSASSYARKYALCGLLAISAGDDVDAHDNRDEGQRPKLANPYHAANVNRSATVVSGRNAAPDASDKQKNFYRSLVAKAGLQPNNAWVATAKIDEMKQVIDGLLAGKGDLSHQFTPEQTELLPDAPASSDEIDLSGIDF